MVNDVCYSLRLSKSCNKKYFYYNAFGLAEVTEVPDMEDDDGCWWFSDVGYGDVDAALIAKALEANSVATTLNLSGNQTARATTALTEACV